MTKYSTGYNLERYCMLTLAYNGYHICRKPRSLGIEDIVAFNDQNTLLIQVKKNKRDGRYALTKIEQEVLKKHAQELGAIPIYLYWEDGQKYWLNLGNGCYYTGIEQYSTNWLKHRQQTRKMLKDKYRTEGKKSYNTYVLENWDAVKSFIC